MNTSSASATNASGKASSGFRPYRAFRGLSSGETDATAPSCGSEPSSVETIEEDGVIVKIRVHCKCGEITEIECGY